MKKVMTMILAAALAISMMTGCGESPKENTETPSETVTEETTETTEPEETKEEGFTLYYPSYMQEQEGEALVLEQKPEKIIALSNAALQIMIRCDVKPIAVSDLSSSVEWPDWTKELPVITAGMSDLDIEGIVAMEPDLVIMGKHFKEDYGKQLQDAEIPVYYTSQGPSITYSEAKEEAITLTRSFGSEEDIKKVEAEFEAVEKRAAKLKESNESKKAMILFGAPPSYQQTSKGYLGSMLQMLPIENMSDELISAEERTTPLDMEKLMEMNPEVLFAISPTANSAEMIQGVYEEEFQKNPEIWNQLSAVENEDLIYLSNEYVTSKGIHIIDSLSNLMDMLSEHFEWKE